MSNRPPTIGIILNGVQRRMTHEQLQAHIIGLEQTVARATDRPHIVVYVDGVLRNLSKEDVARELSAVAKRARDFSSEIDDRVAEATKDARKRIDGLEAQNATLERIVVGREATIAAYEHVLASFTGGPSRMGRSGRPSWASYRVATLDGCEERPGR